MNGSGIGVITMESWWTEMSVNFPLINGALFPYQVYRPCFSSLSCYGTKHGHWLLDQMATLSCCSIFAAWLYLALSIFCLHSMHPVFSFVIMQHINSWWVYHQQISSSSHREAWGLYKAFREVWRTVWVELECASWQNGVYLGQSMWSRLTKWDSILAFDLL